MVSLTKTSIACLLAFSTFLSSNAGALESQANLSKQLATITNAVPIKRVAARYPTNEARAGREGWVVLSYVIETDGEVSGIVIEDSSGSSQFEREAIRAVEKWQFSPAIEDGKPVTQCKNTVQLDFKMHNSGVGVSRKFLSLHNRFNEALNNESATSTELDKLAQSMENYEIVLGIESYYQNVALAQYAEKQNQPEKQLYHLDRALRFSRLREFASDTELTQKQMEVKQSIERNLFPVLHQKLLLELETQDIANAIKTVNSLLSLEINKKHHPLYAKQQEHLEALINSDQLISKRVNLANKDVLKHRLLRNKFMLKDIDGRLTKLDVRCQNQRHIFSVNEQSAWQLPEHWQACSVLFYGENDTTFTIVELPEGDNLVASTSK
ncbi:energy transducer TonB [Thalassotalea sp. LPB0316]|uniref:energy transducer TonB n=1 Tax=Thalassotalea sp. LPB0316 TaxID=2769490 RepID=UPI001867C9F8|nr:energy transducer TonB [Thalassotalea sp. LPB0316]QOL27034.1 energy transducer TonB [Thalassotalea sp. LPB0316]